MHVTLVEINVHEDKVDEFIEVFRQNHLGSVQEEGNLRFDVLQGHHLSVRLHPYQSAKSPEYQAFRRFTVRHGSRQIVDSRTP
ncbi:autoinducer-2 (AI-2) modifying protein LsrG [Shigella flexneri]|nr:autoinducer-2 (AI-2) modifying protein LsrG [Shigella flexneri]